MAKSKCSKKDATSKKKRQRSPPPSPVLTPRKAKGNAIDKLADRAVQDKQRPAWLSLSPVAYTAYAISQSSAPLSLLSLRLTSNMTGQQARLKGVGPRLKTFDDKGRKHLKLMTIADVTALLQGFEPLMTGRGTKMHVTTVSKLLQCVHCSCSIHFRADHLFVKKMMKIGTKKRQGNNNRAHVPPISTNFVTHDNSSRRESSFLD